MTNIITMPFAWVMRLLYSLTGSYGMTLIFFTLVVKLVMLPFQMKSKKSMVRMGRLSSRQAELQKKYANNQQKYQEELQKLYTEAGVNPMSGCLWGFLPLAIILPLYSIVRQPLQYFMRLGTDVIGNIRELAQTIGYAPSMTNEVYSAYEQINLAKFVTDNWENFQGKFDGLMPLNFQFLGIDLSAAPTSAFQNFKFEWGLIGLILIPVLSGFLSWLLSHITMKSNGQTAAGQQGMMKSMNIIMPLTSVYIGFILPASLGIYWVGNSVFSIIQEMTLGRYFNKKFQTEEDEREAAREADRKLRMEEAKRQDAQRRENPKAQKKGQEKKQGEKKISTNDDGRIGGRPYARGRSYVADRYDKE